MYVKVKDGAVEAFPYGQRELMNDNPNTSFPSAMSDEVLAEWDVLPVQPTEIPQPFDPIEQDAASANPVMLGGMWVQTWIVTPASPEEVAQRTNDLANSVRAERDYLLSQTDWMALTDTTLTPAWATYRQELRDVTKQPGFPKTVVWPTKP